MGFVGFRTLLLYHYPVSKTLFSFLSGREIALLDSILHLGLSTSQRARYSSLVRALPEHQAWLLSKLSDRYTIVALGKDLLAFKEQLGRPLDHWNKHHGSKKLTIWLAVIPRDGMEDPLTRTTLHGTTKTYATKSLLEDALVGGEALGSIFSPIPGPTNTKTFDRDRINWYENLTPNAEGIRIMFYAAQDRDSSGYKSVGLTHGLVPELVGYQYCGHGAADYWMPYFFIHEDETSGPIEVSYGYFPEHRRLCDSSPDDFTLEVPEPFCKIDIPTVDHSLHRNA
ncbi:hypothetical protein LTS18_009118 [Coniosporium uncinatum]|uniref:Uncharacterized protein n=1 Tax=Coniosporium uncinatum TaxID=93489 RepID=A0ACC3DCJ8_9PEZI|nr:hypothetical protein LTS18_009118 [Coniosporium uncinatum]